MDQPDHAPLAGSSDREGTSGYLVLKNGVQTGPFRSAQLQSMVTAGMMDREDFAWTNGMVEWLPVWQVLGMAPPPPTGRQTASTQAGGKHSRIRTHLGLSIFTVLMCIPLGVVALVYSCQSSARLKTGDVDGARRAA